MVPRKSPKKYMSVAGPWKQIYALTKASYSLFLIIISKLINSSLVHVLPVRPSNVNIVILAITTVYVQPVPCLGLALDLLL